MRKLLGVLALVALSNVLFATTASAGCVELYRYLYDSGCDPTNWCWWQPQGQMEYLYRVAYDCDGDGYADTFSWVTVEGDCCW